MSKKRTVVIVQCRLRSTRLPGKALLPLVGGMSLLEFLLRRLLLLENADEIVLTTGVDQANDPIASSAETLGVKCVRGAEDDVLSRFVQAADETNAQTIVRVCADNPLTDPKLIDELIDLFHRLADVDHLATFDQPSVPYGVGCAIFSRHALELADKNCTADDPSREHVEPFMLSSDKIQTHHYLDRGTRHLPELRVTVDSQRDYDYVQPIAAVLYRRHGIGFCTEDLIGIVGQPRVALFANGQLGLTGAQFLRETNADIAALILHPEKSSGRRDEIRSTLALDPENVIDYTEIKSLGSSWFEEREIDMIVSLWSSYIFKADLIERIPLGVYNLHNSMLPSLGGCGANIWALLLEVQSGATLHRVTPEIDRGPILDQRPLSASLTDTGGSLFDKQHNLMMQILRERWDDLSMGRYDYIEPSTEPSYFSKSKRDGRKIIDLDESHTARDLLNIIRAYQFGEEDAAYFTDKESGEAWDVRISIQKRTRT